MNLVFVESSVSSQRACQPSGMDAARPAMGDDVFIPIHIHENDVYEGASKIIKVLRPNWILENVIYKIFTDGITNKLVGCFYKYKDEIDAKDVVLVRIYGNKTDLLIDRKAELRNIKLLHKVGLAPSLYAVFENGLAYQYVSGVTLSVDSILLPEVWKLVARQMALMHKVQQDDEISFKPILWSKTEKFLSLVPEQYTNSAQQIRYEEMIQPLCELRSESQQLKSHLIKLGSPVVFSHNDLLLGNVIYNEKKQRVTFIDYEYADYNYQAFDIGNHFAEFVGLSDIDYSRYPSREFQLSWLAEYLDAYLDREATSQEVETLHDQVNQFVLASHFFWGIWALIQAEYSNIDFDFLEYAAIRFKEYYDKKDNLFSLNNKSS